MRISYNARYVKYRGAKKPSFPDFGFLRPGWFQLADFVWSALYGISYYFL